MSPDRLLVLCVEDDRDTQVIVELSLTLDPTISAVVVGSGEKALKLINQGLKPDVLLLEIRLPGMSGVEIAAEARKQNAGSDPIIIFLTAYIKAEQVLRDHDLDDALIISKPFDPIKLAATIRGVLHSRRAQRKTAEGHL